jgi:hypothetical protein
MLFRSMFFAISFTSLAFIFNVLTCQRKYYVTKLLRQTTTNVCAGLYFFGFPCFVVFLVIFSKRQDFLKKNDFNMKTCFYICTPFMLHFSESKNIQRHTNLRRSSYTVLVIFVLFQPNVSFLTICFGTNP